MNRLTAILEHKRRELAEKKKQVPLVDVRRAAEQSPIPLDFMAALCRPAGGKPRLIAEVKCASPSRGILVQNFDPLQLATIYRANGAAAISVLTDEFYFHGSLRYLEQISALHPGIPTLRKDFILDPYQIYEARAAGASAVLLIAAALEVDQMKQLRMLCEELKMTALLEAHSAAEVDQCLSAGAQCIGINNRNLATFEVNLQTSLDLCTRIPEEFRVVAESGIFTRADVDQVAMAGMDAILVGEALVTAPDIAEKVRELAGCS